MDTIAFARGVPAPEMLSVDELRAAAARAMDGDTVRLLSYGTGAGWEPLRQHLATSHGVDAARVVVTTGSLQGFGLLAEVLSQRARSEGRRARVIVEAPTYDRPLLLLDRLGIDVVQVPLGPDGVDVDAFERACAGGADLAYLIPTFQNPAGATLPDPARDAVLASARRHGVLLLEDDPYGLLHFDQPAPRSLLARSEGDETVAFSGSYSKTIAPGLRVGWLVLPVELAAAVATLANDTYISASFLGQATVHEFLEAGAFEPGVGRARAQLRERCELTVAALRTHLPGATYTAPSGGYFIWVGLPDGLDAVEVARAAANEGVSLVAGPSFGPGCEHFVRLAFSSPPLDQLDEGVRRLAAGCAAVATRA